MRIETSFSGADLPKSSCDPKSEKTRLIESGMENFKISGIPIDEYSLSEGISLYVEDDIELILEGALAAEEFISEPDVKEQHNTLYEGGLVITGKKESGNICMLFKYYPGLDASQEISKRIIVSYAEYINWWRGITDKITNAG